MDTQVQEDSRAIPFIINVDNQFVITKEAEVFLKGLEGRKIGLACIVGKYRTGKSYLINRVLLERTNGDGFKVGPTVNPCTKGLWIWNKTIKSKTADKEEMDIIVMDCEGFGGMDENNNHDTRIFLFALLLSSCFVYNSLGSIDETALQTLSLVVNLAKEIRMKNSDKDIPTEEDIAANFPSFLWIIRDFALRLVDREGNQISQREYLEQALREQKGNTDAIENKNKIRKMLRTFFHDRDCVTMCRPVSDETELQRLDTLPDLYIKDEFKEQSKVVRNKIMRKTKVKTVGKNVVTSEMLLHIANGYANSINTGKIPTIESAWTYMCKQKADDVGSKCVEMIDEMIRGDNEIHDMIRNDKDWKKVVRERLLAVYRSSTFEESKDVKEREGVLVREMDSKMESLYNEMMHRHKTDLYKYLDKQFEAVYDRIHEGTLDDMSEYNKMVESIERAYNESNPSVSAAYRHKMFVQYTGDKSSSISNSIMNIKHDKDRRQYEIKDGVIQQLNDEIAEMNARHDNDTNEYKQKIAELNKKVEAMGRENASYRDGLEEMKRDVEGFKNKLGEAKSMYDDMCIKYNSDISDNKHTINMKDNEIMKLANDIEVLNNKIVHINSLQESKGREHEGVIEGLKKREQEHINTINSMKIENNNMRSLYDDIDVYKNKMKILENEHNELKIEKQYVDNQLSFYKEQIEDNKRLHDTLLHALQQQLSYDDSNNTHLMYNNKHINHSMIAKDNKIKQLEDKISRYNVYKQMIYQCKSLLCKHTGKLIPKHLFIQHINQINNQNNVSIDSSSNSKIVHISHTSIIDDNNNKPYTQYTLDVSYNHHTYKIYRSYKEFCDLHHSIVRTYTNIKLPSSCNNIIGFNNNISSSINKKHSNILEERKQALEDYLNELFNIPVLSNSHLLLSFIKYDIYNSNTLHDIDNHTNEYYKRSASNVLVDNNKENL